MKTLLLYRWAALSFLVLLGAILLFVITDPIDSTPILINFAKAAGCSAGLLFLGGVTLAAWYCAEEDRHERKDQ